MKNFNTKLMQLVLGRYDQGVRPLTLLRNSNFSVQTEQSCQEIPNCSNLNSL